MPAHRALDHLPVLGHSYRTARVDGVTRPDGLGVLPVSEAVERLAGED